MSQSNILLMITADNRASQELQKIQGEVKKTGDVATQANRQVAESTQQVQRNYLQASASFAVVGTSVAGLATSFSNLDRAQIRADAAQRAVTAAMAQAESAQISYTNAVKKYGPESEQARAAALRLQSAQEGLAVANDRATLAQTQLSDTYLNFIVGIGPQMFGIIFGLQRGFQALGITSVQQLIPAIRGVGTAFRGAFLTPPPIGLIIGAVATAAVLLATNFGGVRDAVVELGKRIFEFIQQHLRPLADALQWLNNNVIQPIIKALGIDTVAATNDAEMAFDSFKQETIAVGRAIGATKEEIDALVPVIDPVLTTAVEAATEELKGIEAQKMRNIELFGAVGRTALESGAVIAGSMKAMHDTTVPALRGVTDEVIALFNALRGLQDRQSRLMEMSITGVHPRAGKIPAHMRFGSIAPGVGFVRPDLPTQLSILGQEQQNIMSRITSIGQAAGVAFSDIVASIMGTTLGGFLRTASGTRFIQTQFGEKTGILGITPSGTTFASTHDIGIQRIIDPAVVAGVRAGTITSVSTADIIKAQHEFIGTVNRPTLFLAGEGGMPEDVRITHAGKAGRSLAVILEIDGRAIAEAIIDDVDELLTTETIPTKLKVRGVRLQ